MSRSNNSPLRLAQPAPVERPAADLDAVQEFIDGAKPEVIKCRSIRQSLEKAVARWDAEFGYWYVELACTRCSSRFTMELDSKGIPVRERRGSSYAPGYLFSGHGHMDPQGKGLVRLAWLTGGLDAEEDDD